MTHCRYYHTCNLVKNPSSGNREIVVVGGLDEQRQDHCRFIQEVEVFDLDTQQWRNGREGSFCFLPGLVHTEVIYNPAFILEPRPDYLLMLCQNILLVLLQSCYVWLVQFLVQGFVEKALLTSLARSASSVSRTVLPHTRVMIL